MALVETAYCLQRFKILSVSPQALATGKFAGNISSSKTKEIFPINI
jgi:hypothetical protein